MVISRVLPWQTAVGVEFQVDGVALATDTSSPYSASVSALSSGRAATDRKPAPAGMRATHSVGDTLYPTEFALQIGLGGATAHHRAALT